MRQIKFRAWDTEHKVMFQVWKLSCGNGPYKATPESLYSMDFNKGLVDFQKCELMQFTGLLDKNGKEIYEGDIVKYSFEKSMIFLKDGVQYNAEHSGDFEYGQGVVQWIGTMFAVDTKLMRGNMPDHGQFEVVGNVYENSELLK